MYIAEESLSELLERGRGWDIEYPYTKADYCDNRKILEEAEKIYNQIPLEDKLDMAVNYLFSIDNKELPNKYRAVKNHILAKNNIPVYKAGEEVISTFKGLMYVAENQSEKEAIKFAGRIQCPVNNILKIMEYDISRIYFETDDRTREYLDNASFREIYNYLMENDTELKNLITSSAPYDAIIKASKGVDKTIKSIKPVLTINNFEDKISREQRAIYRNAFYIPYVALVAGASVLTGDYVNGLKRLGELGALSYGREAVNRLVHSAKQSIEYLSSLDNYFSHADKGTPDTTLKGDEREFHFFEKCGETFWELIEKIDDNMAKYTGFNIASAIIFGTEIALGIMSPYTLIPLAAIANSPKIYAKIRKRFQKKEDGLHISSDIDTEQSSLERFTKKIKRAINVGISVGKNYFDIIKLKYGKKVDEDEINEIKSRIISQIEKEYGPILAKGVTATLDDLYFGESTFESIRGVTDSKIGSRIAETIGKRKFATKNYRWSEDFALDISLNKKLCYDIEKGNTYEICINNEYGNEQIFIRKRKLREPISESIGGIITYEIHTDEKDVYISEEDGHVRHIIINKDFRNDDDIYEILRRIDDKEHNTEHIEIEYIPASEFNIDKILDRKKDDIIEIISHEDNNYNISSNKRENAGIIFERLDNNKFGGISVNILNLNARNGNFIQYPVIKDGKFVEWNIEVYKIGLTDICNAADAEKILYHEVEHLVLDIQYYETLKELGNLLAYHYSKNLAARNNEEKNSRDNGDSRSDNEKPLLS